MERKSDMSYINFDSVFKEYRSGTNIVRAADGISFEIEKGEFVVILGPSGAGKSTVLNLLGGMDHVTRGHIHVDGQNIAKYSGDKLTAYRRDAVGFVFQFYNLIPTLTAYENVSLVTEVKKDSLDPAETLDMVGLSDHTNQFPPQLSGGEQQRVSIARAICKNPKLLLCDEPTGALDSETGIMILALLQRMSRKYGQTVVIVSHNAAISPAADRVIRLRNGKVSHQIINEAPINIEEVSW